MTQHIKRLLAQFTTPATSWHSQLITQWGEIIGPLAEQVTLEKIEGNTLILGVFDSCWMQELYMLSSVLISTINKKLDQPYIKQVRFKKATEKHKKRTVTQAHVETPVNTITLNHHQQTVLDAIKDPELRLAIKNFFARCRQER